MEMFQLQACQLPTELGSATLLTHTIYVCCYRTFASRRAACANQTSLHAITD